MLLTILIFIVCFPYLLFKHKKDKKESKLHLYGIEGFFGLPGKGKTITMVHRLKDLRHMYGDNIYIMTNFFYKDQDFEFTSWRDLFKKYDRPLVCAWDEVQNEFCSRDFKTFPTALLGILTNVRKDNGIMILYTAQRWHFVDKNFRTLSKGCYECNTILGCFTVAKYYDALDYDALCSQSDYDKRRKIRPKFYTSFVQTDKLREAYDSYKMLDSAINKEYMDRTEIALTKGYIMGE